MARFFKKIKTGRCSMTDNPFNLLKDDTSRSSKDKVHRDFKNVLGKAFRIYICMQGIESIIPHSWTRAIVFFYISFGQLYLKTYGSGACQS